MNIRKFQSNKEELIKIGRSIVSSSDDAKFLRKVTIVNMLLMGAKASTISKSCGETTRTLTLWVKSVDEKGFESLRVKKQTGRPNKLSAEQKEKVKVAITSNPSDYGFNVWDGPSLSSFIEKEFKVSLGVRQCQRLMHQLGFSLIRPQTFPSKDSEENEERQVFKKKLLN